MEKTSLKRWVTVVLVTLPLLLSACATWWNLERDTIRRAVVAYELDERRREVDDVIIRLSPGEFRADFGHGSRMVWLVSGAYDRAYREEEYFKVRDPERSYLFLQDVDVDPSQNRAIVAVVLYSGSGKPIEKEISLHKSNDNWEASSGRVLSGAQAE
jgi:hypothetical protein